MSKFREMLNTVEQYFKWEIPMQNPVLHGHKLTILTNDREPAVTLTVEIEESQLGARPYMEFPLSFDGKIVNVDTAALLRWKQVCPLKAVLEGRSYAVVDVKTDGSFKAIQDGDWL